MHAQDRLFQMEIVRRLAKGELAEILGPKLLETDKLFRTLGIRAHAQDYVARMDMNAPSAKALLAYLDGINQYQATHKAPIEFDVLRIPKRPFTPEDSIAVTGYLAYSFAAAFTTEPVMTFIRDKLGPKYLTAFDIDWHPEGVITPLTAETIGKPEGVALSDRDWAGLNHLAQVSQEALDAAGVPRYEGSNAWAISAVAPPAENPFWRVTRTLITQPSVWYEAPQRRLRTVGHRRHWPMSHCWVTPTRLEPDLFQNDDVDLIAERSMTTPTRSGTAMAGWT